MAQWLGGGSNGAWRAAIPPLCVAVAFAALAMTDLGVGGLALAFPFVLVGAVRVAYWQLHLGRQQLESTDSALVFQGPSGVVREANWADVAEVRLDLAPRYAEWTRLGATSLVLSRRATRWPHVARPGNSPRSWRLAQVEDSSTSA
jgi:hypothetical protein